MRTEAGVLVGIIETFRDISDYKQLQKQIQESEEHYRALIELGTNIGEAVVLLQDIDNHEAMHTYMSDRWPYITGYSREELLHKSFIDIVSPQYREASLARHRLKMSGKSIPDLFEMTIITKDGKEVPIELTSATTIYAGKPANSVYIRDITHRMQLYKALERSEILYHTLFETTGTATAVVGGDGLILRVNGEWELLHGYSKAEVQSKKNYLDLFHQDEVERMRRYFQDRVINPLSVPRIYETRMIDKKCNTKYVLTTVNMIQGTSQRVISQMDITPLRQANEQLIVYQEHLEDLVKQRTSQLALSNERMLQEIENRKLVELELKDIQRQLKGKNKQQVQFTRALVHEMKTYLTPLVVASELLSAQVFNETLKTISLTIQSSVTGLNHRVDELLDVARGQVGLISLNCTWVNLKELCKKISCDGRLEAENNGQIFKFDSSERLPRMWADEDRLMQILLNLLNNAFRYTPRGGRIGFSVRAAEQKVYFEVSDTGPGLDGEQLKQVFEPYRIIQEKGRKIHGLGLGLPLARMLARLHGGKISVRSQVGKGSIFKLVMPLQAEVHIITKNPQA